MKYGAMNYPVRPVLDEIDAIAALGFDYLELAMDPPRAHYSAILAQKRTIMAALGDNGMDLVCHLPTFVYTADLTESIREASRLEMVNSLEAAAELGAVKAVVHPGLISGLGTHVMETARALAMESLVAISARAESLGIHLCLENMFPRYRSFTEPEAFADIFERLPGLGLTLDTGHANIGSNGNRRLLAFVKALGSRIGHVHLSDNFATSDDHLPLGQGTINFQEFAKALKASGYKDTVTLEIFTGDRNDLVRSRDAFERLWGTG